MQNIDLSALLLLLISAGAYVAATYFMKLWISSHHTLLLSALIVITLLIGVASEIFVLKTENMGQVYLIIIGLECVLLAAFAKLALNESYSTTELAGLFLIVTGVAILQLPDANTSTQGDTLKTVSAPQGMIARNAPQVPFRKGKSDKLAVTL
ncbi:MAG: hypothetical protein AAGF81_16090 [Pseudomonadota bacterium]